MKSKINLMFLGLFVVSAFFSLGQLSVSANDKPCEGLTCTQPSDCGSSCFCNGPTSGCFLN